MYRNSISKPFSHVLSLLLVFLRSDKSFWNPYTKIIPSMSSVKVFLEKVYDSLFTLTDQEFFNNTCLELTQALELEYFFIALLNVTTQKSTTLSYAHKGKLLDNYSYDLNNTPCKELLTQNSCLYARHVKDLFPENNFFNSNHIESYLGLPLSNTKGEVIGLMVGMSSMPNEHLKETHEGLKRIATRTSLELERRLLIEALEKSKLEAELANKTKSDFLAMMSHEIRTPLSSILGSMHILKEEALTKTQKTWVETVKDASNNLMVILNDIMDYSKIEANQLNLEHIPFDLRDVIKYCVTLNKENTTYKGLTFREDYEKMGSLSVYGDPTRLSQIISNFMSNAIKFTSEGYIEISTIIKSKTKQHTQVQITVKDTGIGMSPEQLEKITQPFVQAEEHTHRHYGGSGLGIPICLRIAELMKGSIDIISEVNKGSTFTLNLNLENCDPKLIIGHHIKDSLKRNYNKKVLIVEDNHINAKVARKILANLGIESIRAVHGKEALKMAIQEDVDLILMDLNMPEMDGYEATEKLKAQSYKKPILALSANIHADMTKDFMKKKGFDSIISKPFKLEHLIRELDHFLVKDMLN